MKSEKIQEEYYVRLDTLLPSFLPYPRFLLKMDISHTARLLYSLLLDRTTLSQKNGWQDEKGRVYVIFPITEMAETMNMSMTSIKTALKELDAAGLLTRKRSGFSTANHLYVKLPPFGQISDPMTDGKPPLISAESRPIDGQKTDLMMDGKLSPNQLTINNLTESQRKRVSEQPPSAFGRYNNVFLSDTELDELRAELPDKWEYYIDRLSTHIASKGTKYRSHAATIYKWAQEDEAKKPPKKGIPDYTFKEGESL